MFSKLFANTKTVDEVQLFLDADFIADVNDEMSPIYLDSEIDLPTNPKVGHKYIMLNSANTYIGAEDSNYIRVTTKGKKVNVVVDQSSFLTGKGGLDVQLRNAVNAFISDWDLIQRNTYMKLSDFITSSDVLRYGSDIRAFIIVNHPQLFTLLSKCKDNMALNKTLTTMGHHAWLNPETSTDKSRNMSFKIGNTPVFTV